MPQTESAVASDRYSRQLALPGFGAVQQRALAEARVLVIGAGGLGSAVIPALAAAGIGHLGIIDDDRVESLNLPRQLIHGFADVGRAKVHSAADAVAALGSGTQVTAIEGRLLAATALDLFATYDVIVDGSDNFPTRYLANDAALLTGIPVVWGAVSQYGGQASVAWAARGPHYRDLFPVPPAPGSVLSCEVGGVLPTVCAVIGSIMATEVIKVVTGLGTPLIGRVTTYDALTGAFRDIPFASDPSAAPVSQLIDYDLFCGLGTALSAAALANELASATPPTLVDVREPWEAEIASITGSKLLPLGRLDDALEALRDVDDLVLYCHHGIRSQHALDHLETQGITARHLDGGIDAWARSVDPTMARY